MAAGYFTEGPFPTRTSSRRPRAGRSRMSRPRTTRSSGYLRTPRAIRERCEALYALARARASSRTGPSTRPASARSPRESSWARREPRTPTFAPSPVTPAVATSPSAESIALRAFDARLAALARRASGCRAKFELAITSVLLDAGAGDRWRYREAGRQDVHALRGPRRGELRSLRRAGVFSDDPARAASRRRRGARARQRSRTSRVPFRSTPTIPWSGSRDARRSCGAWARSSRAKPDLRALAGSGPRGPASASRAGGSSPRRDVLGAVLDALGAIWPGREVCAGQEPRRRLDALQRSAAFLFTSCRSGSPTRCCEPLEWAGVTHRRDADELTGLAEYRNGGLFVDGGVLRPEAPGRASRRARGRRPTSWSSGAR